MSGSKGFLFEKKLTLKGMVFHREHTLLQIGRERSEGTKTMNTLPLSPSVISFTLRYFTTKTVVYKSCGTL